MRVASRLLDGGTDGLGDLRGASDQVDETVMQNCVLRHALLGRPRRRDDHREAADLVDGRQPTRPVIEGSGQNHPDDARAAMRRNGSKQQVHGAVAVRAFRIIDQPSEAVGHQNEVVRRLSDVGRARGDPITVRSHAD